MRLICGPETCTFPEMEGALRVVLYGQAGAADRGSAGDAVKSEIQRRRLVPAERAWDLLSIALSVVTADFAGLRDRSPDGWTREFEIDIAVADPAFWTSQAVALSGALGFLTTDRWTLHFQDGGMLPAPPRNPVYPTEDCIALLSGGLDSLIGVIDLAVAGRKPFVVSQTVRGDADKQVEFAGRIGGGLNHLQLNHNAHSPGVQESSQRGRSVVFMAFGVVAATSLQRYHQGLPVPLYVCEKRIHRDQSAADRGTSRKLEHPDCASRVPHPPAAHTRCGRSASRY